MPEHSFPIITLKPGRERSVENRHPWIFSGAVAQLPKPSEPGAVVDVESAKGMFLARGFYNPASQIAVRILSFKKEQIDETFFSKRIEAAIELRKACFPDIFGKPNAALRLVHAEADGLPGFIVDRYGDVLVVQCLSAGMKTQLKTLTELLGKMFSPRVIFDKSETGGKNEEGISFTAGALFSELPNGPVSIEENGLSFLVNIEGGQKTGFYLDLRDIRTYVRQTAAGKRILNMGCYTGAISVCALSGGALKVVSVDSSDAALTFVARNLDLNTLPKERHQSLKADMFQFLRSDTASYDTIILDPPAFAQRKKDIPNALKGYKELHLSALKRLRPGGELITLCCSHHMNEELFEQVIFFALKDLGLGAHVVRRFFQPADHPVSPFFPEGKYFKGCVVRLSS